MAWPPVTHQDVKDEIDKKQDKATLARSRWYFSIADHGAEQGTYLTDVSMTSGSPVVNSAGYNFTTDDVGKVVGVRGAGTVSADYGTVANDGVLVGTIVSVSGGDATLDVNAVTSCSGVPGVVGEPIDTALAAAIAECTAAGGGTVYFPAGTWVAQARASFGSRVSFAGAGRANSRIYVAKVVASATDTAAAWLHSSGAGSGAAAYAEVNLSDFTTDGSFFACSGPYGWDMKMIHISSTIDSTVERIATINNPATAIGYDESINCLIANNKIINPGRLAVPSAPHGSSGGSGIGVAVGGKGVHLSMTIRDNYLKGLWTPEGGTGRSGINLEASSDSSAPTEYYGGLHIVNNYVEGFFNGVVDCGAIGTLVAGNTIRGCTNGIRAGSNGIPTGFVGRDMSIIGNVIEDCVSGTGFTGRGIEVTSTGAAFDSEGRTLISDNIITGSAGYGMLINGGAYPLRHVAVRGNAIRDSGLSGLRISGTLYDLAVTHNSITGSGKAGVTTNDFAISLGAGTSWNDGRLQDNDFYDYAATPTQNSIVNGSSLVNVRRSGNTDDA